MPNPLDPGLASLTLVLALVIRGGIQRKDVNADGLLVGARPVELGDHDGVLEGQIRVGAGKVIPRAGVDDFKLIPQLGRGVAQKALVLGALKAHIHVVVPGDEALVPHRADGGPAVDRVVDAQLAADAVKLAQDARGELRTLTSSSGFSYSLKAIDSSNTYASTRPEGHPSAQTGTQRHQSIRYP